MERGRCISGASLMCPLPKVRQPPDRPNPHRAEGGFSPIPLHPPRDLTRPLTAHPRRGSHPSDPLRCPPSAPSARSRTSQRFVSPRRSLSRARSTLDVELRRTALRQHARPTVRARPPSLRMPPCRPHRALSAPQPPFSLCTHRWPLARLVAGLVRAIARESWHDLRLTCACVSSCVRRYAAGRAVCRWSGVRSVGAWSRCCCAPVSVSLVGRARDFSRRVCQHCRLLWVPNASIHSLVTSLSFRHADATQKGANSARDRPRRRAQPQVTMQ